MIRNSFYFFIAALTFSSFGQSNVLGQEVSSNKPDTKTNTAASEGFTLTSVIGKTSYSQGENFFLSVTLKNIGDNAISVLQTSFPLSVYTIAVVDSKGNNVQLTSYGKSAIAASNFSFITRNIDMKPGEQKIDVFEVRRMFDFSRSGLYLINASRKIRKRDDHSKFTQLRSNIVKIIIKNDATK